MKIYKQYIGESIELESSLEDMLEHTEGTGHWMRGTALNILKESGSIFTPYAVYYLQSKKKK